MICTYSSDMPLEDKDSQLDELLGYLAVDSLKNLLWFV
jgi:hypothetical protein